MYTVKMSVRRVMFGKCNIFNLLYNKSIDCRYRRRLKFFSTVRLPEEGLADVNELKDDIIAKIIYNEIYFKEEEPRRKKLASEYKALMEECKERSVLRQNRPLILRYFGSTDKNSEDTQEESGINENSSVVNFPYQPTKKIVVDDVNDNELPESESGLNLKYPSRTYKKFKSKDKFEYENPKKYLGNEERVSDIEPILEYDNYGTCDPNIPCSDVPCSGCGALLHCMSMSIPGFMPKETFTGVHKNELKALRCQRCLFLEEYNVALGINVDPDDYIKIISQITHNNVNIVLMVDLTDFPCSISNDIIKLIENKKRIFVVGNKVDLLLEDGYDSLKHKKKCLTKIINDMDNIKRNVKYVGLISAKTGYGVERLISELHFHRLDQGNFYILGCTNSGKSTLYNRLIQSDMCKVKADLLQRATISQWPGTTLNLLKFPVSRRQDWHSFLRMQRLKVAEKQEAAVREIRNQLMKDGKNCQVNLMGYIGKTKSALEMNTMDENDDKENKQPQSTKWFYDTPGVVHEAQILNLFTTYELTKILPSKIIVPRNFKLEVGHTLFIGGLARIDFLSGSSFAWFTVFASECVPVTVTRTEDADLIYEELLGTKWFVVPHGNKKRLEKWPPLKSNDLEVYGKTLDGRGGDVVLSSAGWVTVSPNVISICRIRAWTPEGRGIYLRQPTLIRNSFTYKGNKIANTPAYTTVMKIYDGICVMDEKQNRETIC